MMTETIVLITFYIGDWVLEFSGAGGYLLLVFPLFLYWRNVSAEKLLGATALAGLLTEMIHGCLAGSLILGLGLAVVIFQALKSVIQWKWVSVRIFGLLLFLFFVFLSRAFFIYVLYRSVVWPDWLALVITILVGSFFVGFGYLPGRTLLKGNSR